MITDESLTSHGGYDVLRPARARIPLVFSSPHSGRDYPQAFVAQSRLCPDTLRRSEDAFVDELFRSVVDLGAPLIRARFPRAYLDVNREPYELDPTMFEGRLPPFANTRSLRVAGGLGTIPRIVGDGQDIYPGRLPAAEAGQRIDALYKPFHGALRALLHESHARFGFVILVDCHSMPSSSVQTLEGGHADIVLGDRYGTSCSPLLTDFLETGLRGLGYAVARNKPYAGGFITEHYGQPATAATTASHVGHIAGLICGSSAEIHQSISDSTIKIVGLV
ncbi:MAG: N-formylglutamate amidohydrolase, partial [Beijerinckiaceae bacterium]